MISASLIVSPRISDWLDLSRQGVVGVRTGKVEIGQGILTALAQIVSDALVVDPARIELVSGRTADAPDEGFTAGSMSVQQSGLALEAACRSLLALCRRHVGGSVACPLTEIDFDDGRLVGPGIRPDTSIWSVARDVGLDSPVDSNAPGNSASRPPLRRIDLEAKLGGGAFIQDLAAPDMLHARVIRPPRLGAVLSLESLTEAERRNVVSERNFVAVVNEDPIRLRLEADRISARLRWSGGVELQPGMLQATALGDLPGSFTTTGVSTGATSSGASVSAVYRRPYLMHASIGCVTALACWSPDGNLDIISQTQGPYPLRRTLAKMFDVEEHAVSVTHAPGAGCYGHNGADDVAADAAIVARHYPGRTVRVSWTRAEELAAAPLAPAGEVAIAASIAVDGRPSHMKLEIISPTHARRPGTAASDTLLGEICRNGSSTLPPPIELPETVGWGALRDARVDYEFPIEARLRLVDPPGLRTSAMRGLGAHLNVFAIESFMDELAIRAGVDPLTYRLSMLSDARARAVVEGATQAADWIHRPAGGGGEGWGLAYSRYKGKAAYIAVVAQVFVDEEVRVRRVWCCADAGRVINMDGLRNQIEGGIVQSASWALFEEVQLDDENRLPTSWANYPIMRFGDVPSISLDVLQSGSLEPLGAGEVAVGPTTAAIANAVADALGVRVRELPFSRGRLMSALLQS